MKVIEVIADAGHRDTIASIAEQHEAEDVWFGPENEDGRIAARLLVKPDNRQNVLDALQSVLQASSNARILILPIEASLPKEKEDEESKKKSSTTISREELFSQVEKGAQLNANFLLLVFLSSIVAAIGLLEDNIAVIVGAMVIAPLLGPNIAFSLGTALGETSLIWKSLKAIAAGVGLAILVAMVIGLLWPLPLQSHELMLRSDVSYSGTAIALASGAAAALSLVTGLSSVLVGVMVAVALMPPAVTIGLMLTNGAMDLATGASLLLAVNIVCINLSAKLVFLVKGIRPRTWLETRKARQSRTIYLVIWFLLLFTLIAVIFVRHQAL